MEPTLGWLLCAGIEGQRATGTLQSLLLGPSWGEVAPQVRRGPVRAHVGENLSERRHVGGRAPSPRAVDTAPGPQGAEGRDSETEVQRDSHSLGPLRAVTHRRPGHQPGVRKPPSREDARARLSPPPGPCRVPPTPRPVTGAEGRCPLPWGALALATHGPLAAVSHALSLLVASNDYSKWGELLCFLVFKICKI